jgi:hypothetical protein
MAIVQIKGSDQKVRFPNDMVEEQMLTALRNQFPRTINEKINDALSKPESTISNRDVSLAENTKQKIANFLYDNKIVSDRYGAQRIGDNLSSLLGVLPGIGDAQAGDEFGRAVAEGDGLGIGIGALSALPIVGDVAAKGARKVFHGSNKQIDEYMRGVNTKGRLGAGIYFGDEKKANVFAKMAKIKKQPSFLNQAEIVSDNPKQVTEDMLLLWPQGKFPAEVFEKEGYTGIQLINQNTGEIIEETVFDPKNIKSLNKPEAKPLGDAVKESDNLKKLADIEQESFDSIMAPLKEEFRSPNTSDNRKQEIRNLAAEYRKPLDSANSKLFTQVRAEQPKPKRIPKQEKAVKTFKGTVYHQTNKDFDNFDLNKSSDGTVWFTDNVKNFSSKSSSSSAASGTGKIMERKVDLKKVAGFEELDKFSVQELIEQGYDGAVLDGDIQVFSKGAIKK